MIKLQITCRFCGKAFELIVTQEQIDNYNNGMVVQKAFPRLTPDERELIISRTCGTCWDVSFK